MNNKVSVRETLRQSREREILEQLESLTKSMEAEGFSITFGEIGQRTTYALMTRGDEEVVGYTFIRDLHYKNPIIGKLKALNQAIARKCALEAPAEIIVPDDIPEL